MKFFLRPGYIIIFILLAIIIVGGWYFLFSGKASCSPKSAQKSETKNNAYSAVFLINGQVYFGKLDETATDYTVLTEVYYLQVDQPIQPAQTKTADQPQISLIKLGDEIHSPEDEMRINKDQILFIENLKDDGQVVKSIKAHK